MKASVVIPTYNRSNLIINTLKALASQSLPSEELEVIIVDDGSTDSTRTVVEQYLRASNRRNWQYIYHSVNRGKSSVCNTAIQASRSSLIVFTDDDCMPQHDWVEMHLKRHSESGDPISVLGAVTFPVTWQKKSNFIRYMNTRYVANRSVRTVGGNFGNLPPNYFGGGNVSVPREQLLQVGLFDERVGRGQDVELGYRLWKAGIRLVYEPKAAVVHYSPDASSIQDWLSKLTRTCQYSAPLFNELHPEFADKFGHWFLEPPNFSSEPLKRTMLKIFIRLIIRRSLAKPMQIFLERTDRWPAFYNPLMYKYIITSACLQGVNQRVSQGLSIE